MNVPANAYYWSRSFGAADYSPYRLGAGDGDADTAPKQGVGNVQDWNQHIDNDDTTSTPAAIDPLKYVDAEFSAAAILTIDPNALGGLPLG